MSRILSPIRISSRRIILLYSLSNLVLYNDFLFREVIKKLFCQFSLNFSGIWIIELIPIEGTKEKIGSLKINSKDVGSSEVQIGLLSNKINSLGDHFKKNKSDKHSTRGLVKAVNQRKRLLEYLKNNNSESYKNILTKLDLRK